MSQIRSFFVGLPLACGVEPKLAKIYGEHHGALFDYEVTNPKGEFASEKFEDSTKRLRYAFHGWTDFADPAKLHYGLMLAVYATNSHSHNAKGIKVDGLEHSRSVLSSQEADYPEVSALLTVEQASVLTYWV